jgi:hypothetical protein
MLALAQLLGGPLILWQVTVFCQLALNEAPRLGMVRAAAYTWHSDDFQAVLASTDGVRIKGSNVPAPKDKPKLSLDKAKLAVIPWEPTEWKPFDLAHRCRIVEYERPWTPTWPQAPPGPPPRVG